MIFAENFRFLHNNIARKIFFRNFGERGTCPPPLPPGPVSCAYVWICKYWSALSCWARAISSALQQYRVFFSRLKCSEAVNVIKMSCSNMSIVAVMLMLLACNVVVRVNFVSAQTGEFVMHTPVFRRYIPLRLWVPKFPEIYSYLLRNFPENFRNDFTGNFLPHIPSKLISLHFAYNDTFQRFYSTCRLPYSSSI